MKVEFSHNFIKIYKKRFSHRLNIKRKFDTRTKLFAVDSQNSLLQDHQLGGKLQGYRAFSITGDIRVIYYVHGNTAYFVDIGTHNQVYGR